MFIITELGRIGSLYNKLETNTFRGWPNGTVPHQGRISLGEKRNRRYAISDLYQKSGGGGDEKPAKEEGCW
jgi:hypothetical protein